MTPLLLDTVFLIRWSQGRVPKRVKRQVDQPGAALFVSTVSPWEISLKPALRQYGLSREDLLEIMLDDLAAGVLPITLQHTEQFDRLPYFPDHTDPFDRMLIAQALTERYTLVSPDTRFSWYESHGLRLLWD